MSLTIVLYELFVNNQKRKTRGRKGVEKNKTWTRQSSGSTVKMGKLTIHKWDPGLKYMYTHVDIDPGKFWLRS